MLPVLRTVEGRGRVHPLPSAQATPSKPGPTGQGRTSGWGVHRDPRGLARSPGWTDGDGMDGARSRALEGRKPAGKEAALCTDLCTRCGGTGGDGGETQNARHECARPLCRGQRRDWRPPVTAETGVVVLITQRRPGLSEPGAVPGPVCTVSAAWLSTDSPGTCGRS